MAEQEQSEKWEGPAYEYGVTWGPDAGDAGKAVAENIGELAKKMLGLFNGGLVNVHDDSNARGYTTHYRPEDAMAAVVEAVRSDDREMRADAYRWRSGKMVHTSDCATSSAPAYEPSSCDCATPAPDKALAGAVAWAPKGHIERYLKGRNTACWVYGSPTAEDSVPLYTAATPMVDAAEKMRSACISAVRAEQKYEASDFPVCNSIVAAIQAISPAPDKALMPDAAVEVVARAICQSRDLSPDTLYQHNFEGDWPEDERREYADPFTGEPRVQLFHRAWRRWDKAARAAMAAMPTPTPVEEPEKGATGLAKQLSDALASKSESRFNAIAFVHRHEIIAALAATNAGQVEAYSVEVVRDMDVPKGAWDWIDSVAKKATGPHVRIETPNDAESIVFWHNEQPAAVVLNIRDQFNHSIQFRAALANGDAS